MIWCLCRWSLQADWLSRIAVMPAAVSEWSETQAVALRASAPGALESCQEGLSRTASCGTANFCRTKLNGKYCDGAYLKTCADGSQTDRAPKNAMDTFWRCWRVPFDSFDYACTLSGDYCDGDLFTRCVTSSDEPVSVQFCDGGCVEWRQGVAGCGNADDGFIGALKLRVQNPSFVAEQKRRANRWIQETAPTPVANNKRALWLVLKKDLEAKRQRYQAAFRNMPCMPFDVWLLMKDEESIATAGGRKVEPPEVKQERKHFYQRLGLERRKRLLGIYIRESTLDEPEDPAETTSFRPSISIRK
eukprot:g2607.t1